MLVSKEMQTKIMKAYLLPIKLVKMEKKKKNKLRGDLEKSGAHHVEKDCKFTGIY